MGSMSVIPLIRYDARCLLLLPYRCSPARVNLQQIATQGLFFCDIHAAIDWLSGVLTCSTHCFDCVPRARLGDAAVFFFFTRAATYGLGRIDLKNSTIYLACEVHDELIP